MFHWDITIKNLIERNGITRWFIIHDDGITLDVGKRAVAIALKANLAAVVNPTTILT